MSGATTVSGQAPGQTSNLRVIVRMLFPSGLSWIGAILGALSVLKLIDFCSDYGFGPTFQLLLTAYENLARAAFGWAEPFVRLALIYVRDVFSWNLDLHSSWKHVLVLTTLYIGADARETIRTGRPGSAAFLLAIGLPTALIASVAAGTVQIDDNDFWANFLLAFIPIIGVTTYDLAKLVWYTAFLRRWVAEHFGQPVENAWPYFVNHLHFVLRIPVIGGGVALAFAALGDEFLQFREAINPGFAALSVLVIMMTINRLLAGASRVPDLRQPGELWAEAYARAGNALLGTAIVRVLLAAAGFILTDVGLKMLGF